ncbi:MAG TPA: DUF1801 domain-containing protein [Candidatus Acidoferrales bacterium]|nr:DUF1801 domain-containing protein [Candidatus Acidoferrales bacterium]
MNSSTKDKSAYEQIDAIIMKLADWRGEKLAQLRTLIKQADPDVIEEVKWKKPSNPDGIPVWSHDGMICTGETYKSHLRLTFAKGTSLKDPKGLFNTYRAIVIHEGDKINKTAFKDLIRTAVELNHKDKNKLKPSQA